MVLLTLSPSGLVLSACIEMPGTRSRIRLGDLVTLGWRRGRASPGYGSDQRCEVVESQDEA